MVNLGEINADLKIDYPCEWGYKVFLEHNDDINGFFKKLDLSPLSIKESKKNAKYTCYDTTFKVDNNAARLELFSLLKKHAKFVL